MEQAAIDEIAAAVRGRIVRGDSGTRIQGVGTDSREEVSGLLYVPLVGERFDGHEFILDVARKGAVACFSTRDLPLGRLPENFAVIRVADTLRAYQDLARWNRLRHQAPVVAITGSCGKTTTKEMIANVLRASLKGGVVGSKGNENNEIGVPKTLLRVDGSTKAVVLEMGMRGPGEVALLAEIARPNFGLITNIERTHIGRLGSEQAIADAKGELIEKMNDRHAVVLNADNRWTPYLIEKTGAMVVRFGIEGKVEVMAREIVANFDGISFVVEAMETKFPVHLPLLGKVNVYNALAAVSVGLVMACTTEGIRDGLKEGLYRQGRMKIERTSNGKVVIDDTYNSNPASLRYALELLGTLPWQHRRVAILGDMLELGEFSREEHRDIGKTVAYKHCDLLITYGKEAKQIGEGALHVSMPPEMVLHFDNLSLFKRRGLGLLAPNDLVLVKGSRGIKMEEIVNLIMS